MQERNLFLQGRFYTGTFPITVIVKIIVLSYLVRNETCFQGFNLLHRVEGDKNLPDHLHLTECHVIKATVRGGLWPEMNSLCTFWTHIVTI